MSKHKELILASQSPRRRELMSSAGFIYKVVPAISEEIVPYDVPPGEAVIILAKQKADEVLELNRDCVVVGADTIVVIDGCILGKPLDKADAFNMLKRLSGRKHSVFTGVAILATDFRCRTFYEETVVEFHKLSDHEIHEYIATDEPFDKAGAYGIQEKGMLLVKEISGDFYNVMGLPISRLSRELRSIGVVPNSYAPQTTETKSGINDLLAIMARLRVECPWDKEQTHASIRINVIEEAYEVAEAIDRKVVDSDSSGLCEELGDLLLQVVFHGQIAKEAGDFDFDDICDTVCKKLIYRHPHVFGNVDADTPSFTTEKVLKNWDDLKSSLKGEKTASDRLGSIPKPLPALMKGAKVGKCAADAGFDFFDVNEAIESLKAETEELIAAIIEKNDRQIEQELGDILFSCCNIGRFLKKDCEKALTFSLNRFIMRFRRLENMVLESGRKISELDANQLDELWQISKKAVDSSRENY